MDDRRSIRCLRSVPAHWLTNLRLLHVERLLAPIHDCPTSWGVSRGNRLPRLTPQVLVVRFPGLRQHFGTPAMGSKAVALPSGG